MEEYSKSSFPKDNFTDDIRQALKNIDGQERRSYSKPGKEEVKVLPTFIPRDPPESTVIKVISKTQIDDEDEIDKLNDFSIVEEYNSDDEYNSFRERSSPRIRSKFDNKFISNDTKNIKLKNLISTLNTQHRSIGRDIEMLQNKFNDLTITLAQLYNLVEDDDI